MRESKVEKYLREQVKKAGGEAEKFVSPGKKNVPDRIVSWPFNIIHFVETKATDKKPNSGQARDHKRRRARGNTVLVLDTVEKVDNYILWHAPAGVNAIRDVQRADAFAKRHPPPVELNMGDMLASCGGPLRGA